jgi:uncharacterized protein
MSDKNKIKIFNDPIYGFISLPDGIVFELINHPWFQRLRRIKQLGMTNLVYPGALHTRFHHALGAMFLMRETISTLRSKGENISEDEETAALIAILLHDIGHGPFSHALEHSIVEHVSHEDISSLFMSGLNAQFKGKLDLAIRVFKNEYKRKFLHQLVSSQLDMDRLDYLRRDSFFTGVSEGVISSDRIVKMLKVVDDALVIEEKGIYSIEKFIISRRLMYWQVYLHKTVLSAEHMLVQVLRRAKELARNGEELFCTPALRTFLYNQVDKKSFQKNPELLDTFALLDDYDILASIKVWTTHNDKVLSTLSGWLINRNLYKVELQNKPFEESMIRKEKERAKKRFKLNDHETGFLVFSDHVSNDAYTPDKIKINILMKDGSIVDIAKASDQAYLAGLQTTVKKYFLCYPK